MDKWLHAQFKVAENILEAVDRNISKNVQPNNSETSDSPETTSTDKTQNATSDEAIVFSAPPTSRDQNSIESTTPKQFNQASELTTPGVTTSTSEVLQSTSLTSVDSLHTPSDRVEAVADENLPSTAAHTYLSQSNAPRADADVTGSSTGVALDAPVLPLAIPPDPAQKQHSAKDGDHPAAESLAASSNRESRLAKLVDTLKRRLDEKRIENEQLEELLQKAEARATEQGHRAQQLQAAAGKAIEDRSSLEASFAAQLTAKEVETTKLRSALDVAQRQVAQLEAAKVVLEERNTALLQGQEQVEAGMLEALKAELKTFEGQLESERRQHQSSKAAASARQEELEHHLAESAAALSSMQRKVEQAESRNFELEERLALLQAQYNRALEQQEISSHPKSDTPTFRSASPGGVGVDAPSVEVETLREEVARSRAALQAAEKARRIAETTAANLRQELAEARSGHNQPTSQLEHEVKEMSEMLYIKQTQLERLAAEKASQQLVLERDLMAARDEIVRLRASSQQQRADHSRHTYDALIPMDALGEPYQRLARHNKVGTAVTTVARFLDTTTTRFVYILRHYPLGRLVVFVYIIFMHLCLYFLTVRMQHLAVRQEAAVTQSAQTQIIDHSLPGNSAS